MPRLKLLTALMLLAVVAVPRVATAQNPGYALRFDGASDSVRLAATASMLASDWPTTKTVSLWLKPTGLPACSGPDPASCDAIFGDRPRTWGIARGVVGGSDRIWIWNYDGNLDRVGIEYTVGEWIHIALVHGGGVLRAYKNGALVGSVPSGATLQLSGATLYFGGILINASKNWTFEGEIDELRLWNLALSDAEILQDLSGPAVPGTPGLAAYYQMSDGSGTVLTDDSGNLWTGTFLDGGTGVPADGPILWVPSGAFGGSNPDNNAPVADSQSVTTAEDTAVAVTLSGSDVENDPLTFRVVLGPSHGTLNGTAPDLTYTPGPDFNGSDSFSFVVNDGWVDSATATVAVEVSPLNDAPAANDGAVIVLEDSAGTPISLAALVSDVETLDGDLVYSIVGGPLNGTLSPGTVAEPLYTPNPNFFGTDSFTYQVTDRGDPDNCPVGAGCSASQTSAVRTVTVTVSPVNDAPGFAAGPAQTVAEDSGAHAVAWATGLSAGPANEADQTFSFVLSNDNNTLFFVQPGISPDGTLTFATAPHQYGTATVTVLLQDSGGTASGGVNTSAPQLFTITVTPVNDDPVAVDDTVGTSIDTAVAVAALANDVELDGDGLTITDVGVPANGAATHDGESVTYTPNEGFTGTDSFSYTISDGQGGSSTGQVTVTVSPANTGPGYALRFDGASDFVKLAYTSHMLAPGWQSTKTVSLWVKPTGSSFCNAPSPASCDAIFGDRPRWWGISRGVINGLDRIWVWNWDGGFRVIAVTYTPGEWMHVALVHGGGMLSAYKNGVLVQSIPSGPTQQPNTGALPVLHIGGVINTTARNWTFDGEIDEVQLWNTARTADEINQDLNRPLSGSEEGLAAYYAMSDGSGTSVTDDSGHGWTGEFHDGGQGVPPDGPIQWVPSGAFFGESSLVAGFSAAPLSSIHAAVAHLHAWRARPPVRRIEWDGKKRGLPRELGEVVAVRSFK